jgi:hypothetical protein
VFLWRTARSHNAISGIVGFKGTRRCWISGSDRIDDRLGCFSPRRMLCGPPEAWDRRKIKAHAAAAHDSRSRQRATSVSACHFFCSKTAAARQHFVSWPAVLD